MILQNETDKLNFLTARIQVIAWRAVRLAVSCLTAAVLVLAGTQVAGAINSSALHMHPQSASVAPRFQPRSVTFPTSRIGWVLGTVRCGHDRRCLALRETKDAGRSWAVRPFPPSLAAAIRRAPGGVQAQLDGEGSLSIHFADARDGWIYGALGAHPLLWSTHDGGRTWSRRSLHVARAGGEGPILALASAAGTARLMMSAIPNGVRVESSPVGVDRWKISATPHLGLPAGGAQLSGAIVLEGRAGWLVEGNDRGTTGSARLNGRGQWVRWTSPCAQVGNSLAVPAASDPQNLVAVCVMGGFAYPLSPAAPPGATLDSSWLYRSTDGGESFHAGPELGGRRTSFEILVSPSPGVLLVTRSGAHGQDLGESVDGGAHWTVVYRGAVRSISFATSTQGFGLVESPSGTMFMIATADGGHHWMRVSF